MKKTVVLILLIILSCKSKIIKVENFENYNSDLPDGAYIKDVNNVLDKYVGTWKGVFEGNNYEFRIIKKTEDNLDLKYKEDLLLMRYKITDSSGNIIENTLSLPDNDVLVVSGIHLTESGGYLLNYVGRDDCGQNGDIYISVYGSQNKKMQLSLHVYGEFYSEDCIEEAQQVIPKEIELTKQ